MGALTHVWSLFFFLKCLIACVCDSDCGAYVCALESSPSFSWARLHLLVPPSAQTVSLFLCVFLLSSAVHQFSFRPPLLISLFIPNSLPGFFPCLFSQIHKPQQFQIPWLCSFSKPHLKNKLITPPTHEITLGKQKAKRKHEKENGRLYQDFPPLVSTVNTGA